MGKSSGSAPKAPDPSVTIPLQEQANLRQFNTSLDASRINSSNLFGKNVWTKTPGATNPDGTTGQPSWSFARELDPAIGGTIKSKLADTLANLSTTGGGYTPELAKAIYDRSQMLVDPQVARDRTAMQTNLAERGFQVQNDGYGDEMSRFEDSVGRQRTDASNAATIAGYQQGNTDQQLKMALAQQLGGMEGQLLGNIPVEANVPGLSAPDVQGAYNTKYQGELGAYNANVGSNNAMMGTLGTLGSAALMASGVGAPAALALQAGMQTQMQNPATTQLTGNLGSGTGLRVPNLYAGMR